MKIKSKKERVVKIPKLAAVSLLFILSACGQQEQSTSAQSTTDSHTTASESPSGNPTQVFWGDTHLHTDNSLDAFGFGNRLDTEAALRFARGEKVESSRSGEAQLARPLDFLVIADHSDGLGSVKRLYNAPRLFVRDPLLRRWWDQMHESLEGSLAVVNELTDLATSGNPPDFLTDVEAQKKTVRKLWRAHNKFVDRYNEPGKFSAFIGFEYTPMPNGNNLHRVVMFRDGAKKANTVNPLPSANNPNPEQLWAWMAKYEQDTGGQILAMPHNGNVSNGLMFAMNKMDGTPIDQAYAETRAKYEPVIEVTQIKGDGESHPFLSPNDEFADFGVVGWDKCNLSCTEEMTPESYAGSYAREALKRGLELEQKVGANPYAFGMIGSTDSHTSLATADEDNFYGKHSGQEPNAKKRALKATNLGTTQGRFGWHYLASGYAAAWATENTREAIFDAFKRREVYATTGPRMSVRFFGGLNYTEADAESDLANNGYAKGVPMGGVINGDGNSSAKFLISALMDNKGANLDRVQVVKGWIDAQGKTHEKVYDVAWSDQDQRPMNAQGKVPAVGNTVNLTEATWTNSIGAVELSTFWQDPEFDPDQNAFYYARVLEIPTPTWALYDSVRNGVDLGQEVVKVQQERAYTSPIWYKPN